MTKRNLAPVEMERQLMVASSAALSAQNSALAKAKKVRKCREKLEDAEERLGVAPVAASKSA